MATPIERHIAQRLRERRNELKLSLGAVAAGCDVSLQTIQKYERALCRVSAGTLFDLACALDVQPAFFYEGFQKETAHAG